MKIKKFLISILIITFVLALATIVKADDYNVSVNPSTIQIGLSSIVEITVLDESSNPLDGIYVGLNGLGIETSGVTSSDGAVSFSILPTSTGEISIDVGSQGNTISEVITVVSWVLDITVDQTSVNEGETFTVAVTNEGTGEAVEGATVSITGISTKLTDINGLAVFTAPSVTSDRTYTITASASGYHPDPSLKTITVINVPNLIVMLNGTQDPSGTYENETTISVYDSFGNPVTEASVDIVNNDVTVTTLTDSNGESKFSVTHTEIKEYEATVSKSGYGSSSTIVFQIKGDNSEESGDDESDSDGDGITDDIDDYPFDYDNDGENDTDDTDDDNDGIDDSFESQIGSDPKDNDDVIEITEEEDNFYLIDTNNDNKIDKVYNPSNENANIEEKEDGIILIDTNGDTNWDYQYDPVAGEISTYSAKTDNTPGFEILLLIFAVILIFIINRRRA
jgi:hypothetical protein